jgi:hypothetical protein
MAKSSSRRPTNNGQPTADTQLDEGSSDSDLDKEGDEGEGTATQGRVSSESDSEGDGSDSPSDASDVDYGPVPKDIARSQRGAWRTLKKSAKGFTLRFSQERWLEYYRNKHAQGGRLNPPALSQYGPQVVLVTLPVHEGANLMYHLAGCEGFTPKARDLVLEAVETLGNAIMLGRELSQVRVVPHC